MHEGFQIHSLSFVIQKMVLYILFPRPNATLPMGLDLIKSDTLSGWSTRILMLGASSLTKNVSFLSLVHRSRKMTLLGGWERSWQGCPRRGWCSPKLANTCWESLPVGGCLAKVLSRAPWKTITLRFFYQTWAQSYSSRRVAYCMPLGREWGKGSGDHRARILWWTLCSPRP